MFSNSLTEKIPSDINFSVSPVLTHGEPMEFDFVTKDGSAEITFKGNEFFNFLMGRLNLNPLKGEHDTVEKFRDIMLNDFESFEAKSSSSQIVDKKSGKNYIQSGPSQSKVTMARIDEDSHKISVSYSLKDMEFSPYLDQALVTLADKIHATTGADTTVLKFMHLSAYGKSSQELDMTYKGPTNFAPLATKGGTFDIDISKYESTNDMQKASMKGKVLVKLGKNNVAEEVNVNVDGTFQATKAFQDYFKTMYKEIARAELDRMAEGHSAPADAQQQAQAAQMIEHVFTMYGDRIFPDIAALGEIKSHVDVFYKHESKSFKLDTSFVTDKFGFMVKGDGTMDKSLDLELTIKNYKEFLDALYAYSKDMLDIANEVTQGGVKFELKDEMKLHVIELLQKMAEPMAADAKDMVIKIHVEGNEVKVGKMNAPELFMAFMMLMPQLQQGLQGQEGPSALTEQQIEEMKRQDGIH